MNGKAGQSIIRSSLAAAVDVAGEAIATRPMVSA
jgi:hypothetical protein